MNASSKSIVILMNAKFLVIEFFFFLLCKASIQSGSRLEKLNPTSVCASLVSWDVFFNSTTVQSVIEANVSHIISVASIAPKSCVDAAVKVLCGTDFPLGFSPQSQVSLVVPVCKSFCSEMYAQCGALFSFYPAAAAFVPKCTDVDPFSNWPLFPDQEIVYNFQNQNFSIPCNSLKIHEYSNNLVLDNNFPISFPSTTSSHWNGTHSIETDSNLKSLVLKSTFNDSEPSVLQLVNLNQIQAGPIVLTFSAKFLNGNMSADGRVGVKLNVDCGNWSGELNYWIDSNISNYQSIQQTFYPKFPILSVTIELYLSNSSNGQEAYFRNISLVATERASDASINIEVSCVEPLLFRQETGACELPCPVEILSPDGIDDGIITLLQVVGWPSAIGSLLTLATWFLRKFGQQYGKLVRLDASVALMAICTFGISTGAGPLISVTGLREVMCRSEWYNDGYISDAFGEGKSACAISGVLIFFFLYSFIWFWFYNVVHIFLVIHYPRTIGAKISQPGITKFDIILNIAIWGSAACLTFGDLFAGKMGGAPVTYFCFVKPKLFYYIAFYGPLCLVLIIASPLMFKSMYTIYKIRNDAEKRQDFWIFFRFLAFLLFMLFNFVVTFAGRVWFEIWGNEAVSSIQTWLVCRNTNPNNLDSCTEPIRPNAGVLVLEAFLTAGQGLVLFLLFVCQPKTLKAWISFFRQRKTETASRKTIKQTGAVSKHTHSKSGIEMDDRRTSSKHNRTDEVSNRDYSTGSKKQTEDISMEYASTSDLKKSTTGSVDNPDLKSEDQSENTKKVAFSDDIVGLEKSPSSNSPPLKQESEVPPKQETTNDEEDDKEMKIEINKQLFQQENQQQPETNNERTNRTESPDQISTKVDQHQKEEEEEDQVEDQDEDEKPKNVEEATNEN